MSSKNKRTTVAELEAKMQEQQDAMSQQFSSLMKLVESQSNVLADLATKQTPQAPLSIPQDALAAIPPAQPAPQPIQPPAQPIQPPAQPPQTYGGLQQFRQQVLPGMVQNAPAMAPQQTMQQTMQHQPPAPAYSRAQAGGQSNASNCACCNQRRRSGTVDLRTGEYIASGLTTQWLNGQAGIMVALAQDGFQQQYKVSGSWLSGELKKRAMGPDGKRTRATSVPGFLCGEPSSNHPNVRLIQPILRRATDGEEQKEYARRVLTEAVNILPQLRPVLQQFLGA